MIEIFKVIAVSTNTNSFGLHQMVLVAKSGVTFKACANSLNLAKKDSEVSVPVTIKNDKIVNYNFTALGYEIPEQMNNAPKEVLKEIFAGS